MLVEQSFLDLFINWVLSRLAVPSRPKSLLFKEEDFPMMMSSPDT